MKNIFGLACLLLIIASITSCKKCITCTARDAVTGELRFQEKSCAKGPLLDDWQDGIYQAYPLPGYNTTCK